MKNESKLTWKDVVREALSKIGNSGHLNDINSQIAGEDRNKSNMEGHRKTYPATVQHLLSGGEGERYMVSQRGKASSGVRSGEEPEYPGMKMCRECCLNLGRYMVMKLGRE